MSVEWKRPRCAVAIAMLLVGLLASMASVPIAGATSAPYTETSLTIPVVVGPDNNVDCNVVAYLFQPVGATASHRDPAILTTNGFGGSREDQVTLGEYFASRGYVVLSYSGLGFGGSGCNIELDLPDYDGKAGVQLVNYLGKLPYVAHKANGEPIVGMIGGSYGGEVQFAVEDLCQCLSAIVPIITWNDLAYSLAPNNNATNFVHTDAVPGVLKYEWDLFFSADGLAQPVTHYSATPIPPSTCPGFDPRVCTSLAQSAALGIPTPSTISFLRSASVVTYMKRITVPTLLMQGEDDSLFELNEAVANYQALKAQGTPVHLVFQSWGHSSLNPAPGEVSYVSPKDGYETQIIEAWFAKYLKGMNVSTGPAVEYFRPWVAYSGSALAAYGTAGDYPASPLTPWYLSGNGALVTTLNDIAPGSESFVNPPGGQTGSYSETSAVGGDLPDLSPIDVPGTFASFESAPLRQNIDVVGVPKVSFSLQSTVPPGNALYDPILYGKIYDVAPNGTKTLSDSLVAPIRVNSTATPISMTLPGIVHQFPAGDRIELVFATTDLAYLGQRVANGLAITIDPSSPSIVLLPEVPVSDQVTGGPRPQLLTQAEELGVR